jgi:DNA-binding NarL/FixJ family response regulator
VVRLVAEGRTNRDIADRLFLSRDTVHTHVSHILSKLGLSSRVELAAQPARRGFLPVKPHPFG